jgi:hypothetical protein
MTPGQMAEQISAHNERLKSVEQGVSNFRSFQIESRAFQIESREFFTEYRAVRQEREEAERRHDAERKEREAHADARRKENRSSRIAIASILTLICLPPASWVSTRFVRYASDIYQIVQEWETVHKSEIQQKNSTGQSDPAYSMNKNTQTAAGEN